MQQTADRMTSRKTVRAIFLSDIHLGCKHSQAAQLLKFLKQVRPQYLYLVGDIIDGRSLRRRWCWTPEFTSLLLYLTDLARQGTQIRYAIGNHDDFLREENLLCQLDPFVSFEIAEEFVHTTHDERAYLVLHGDRFDIVEQSAGFVSKIASVFYEGLLSLNWLWSRLRKKPTAKQFSLSSQLKRRVKSMVKYISDYERRIVAYAKQLSCDGVICGHIHSPIKTQISGLEYCNTGDWVENCTALIEHTDGELELIYFDNAACSPMESQANTAIPTPAIAARRRAPQRAQNGPLTACSVASD